MPIALIIAAIARGALSARMAFVLAFALFFNLLVTSPLMISIVLIVMEVATGWLSRWVLPWGLEMAFKIVAWVLDQTPLAEPLLMVQGLLASPPEGVAWVWSTLRLDLGLSLMLTAYLCRFTIRRLPVVG